MAFDLKNLICHAVGGRSFYYYETDDAVSVVKVKGYFDAAASQLRAGDRIALRCSKAATATNHDAVITDVTDGVVTIGAATAM